MYANEATDTIVIKDEYGYVREVAYWVNSDNEAVIDGDIIYGPVDALMANAYNGEFEDEDQNFFERRAFSVFRGTETWPSGMVVYKYKDEDTEHLLQPFVTKAMETWTRSVPDVKFHRLQNSADRMDGVVTITANPCGGCNSHIGYDKKAPLHMNLQQSCVGGTKRGTCHYAEALHEIGHLLGLKHEHQRPDREQTVHFQCENLNPKCSNMPQGGNCCGTSYPNGCCKQKADFTVAYDFNSAGPYDITSVMQYRANAFALPGKNTLVAAAPGVHVPTHNIDKLSNGDIRRICQLYNDRGENCR
ncbi:zincin [Agrocybe pediades]|nr:zincin [Agrocybe pediades]